jgi:hypothetical protein
MGGFQKTICCSGAPYFPTAMVECVVYFDLIHQYPGLGSFWSLQSTSNLLLPRAKRQPAVQILKSPSCHKVDDLGHFLERSKKTPLTTTNSRLHSFDGDYTVFSGDYTG